MAGTAVNTKKEVLIVNNKPKYFADINKAKYCKGCKKFLYFYGLPYCGILEHARLIQSPQGKTLDCYWPDPGRKEAQNQTHVEGVRR